MRYGNQWVNKLVDTVHKQDDIVHSDAVLRVAEMLGVKRAQVYKLLTGELSEQGPVGVAAELLYFRKTGRLIENGGDE